MQRGKDGRVLNVAFTARKRLGRVAGIKGERVRDGWSDRPILIALEARVYDHYSYNTVAELNLRFSRATTNPRAQHWLADTTKPFAEDT